MIVVNARADLGALHRTMATLGAKQIRFATALALNTVAKGAISAEQLEIDRTFENPTKFTENAFRVAQSATKANPIAVIAAKDTTNDQGGQAAYLKPYVVGGQRYLGKKLGMLVPKAGNIALNAYGNLTKGKLKSLKSKPDVFIGPLKTKDGRVVNGVWQGHNGAKRVRGGPARGMKLLIVFENTTEAPKHLDIQGAAQRYVARHAKQAFADALAKALSTAR